MKKYINKKTNAVIFVADDTKIISEGYEEVKAEKAEKKTTKSKE